MIGETEHPPHHRSFRGTEPRAVRGCPVGASSGHTLLELVIVIAVLAVSATIGWASLGNSLDATAARGGAQSWQVAALGSQLATLWSGSDTSTQAAGDHVVVLGGRLPQDELGAPDLAAAPRANVSRWQQETGVRVGFRGPFGAPDSAGSLTFGSGPTAYQVVVRVESGLTRRVRP
jgi:prepilin-type N-terminal cleavage/methylation domain-containing protein